MEFSGGWDTVATLVHNPWVERRPRRPGAQLLRETRLLPGDRRAPQTSVVWHRLGPWHEVTHRHETDAAAHIHRGPAGLLSRLPPTDQPRSR
ncbi:hypothetical protein ACIBQ0_12570 [Nocardia nova]|uniref:hypothetical protein n=1 Tax=Nocardia nova TaxID=37330 RepID=UPI0037B12201